MVSPRCDVENLSRSKWKNYQCKIMIPSDLLTIWETECILKQTADRMVSPRCDVENLAPVRESSKRCFESKTPGGETLGFRSIFNIFQVEIFNKTFFFCNHFAFAKFRILYSFSIHISLITQNYRYTIKNSNSRGKHFAFGVFSTSLHW